MGKRFSRIELKGRSMVRHDREREEHTEEANLPGRPSHPRPPRQEPKLNKGRLPKSPRRTATIALHREERRSHNRPPESFPEGDYWTMRRQSRPRVATGLSTIPSSTDLQSATRASSKSSWNKHSTNRPQTGNGEVATTPLSISRSRARRLSIDLDSLSSVELHKPFRRERDPVKRRLLHAYQDVFVKTEKGALPQTTRSSLLASPIGRKRSVSLDDRHFSYNPVTFATPPVSFSYESFAAEKYATQRVGLFRRKCPIDRLMRWQKESLRSSLLPLESSELRKDALRIFHVILRYCGDRISPVFWPKVPYTSPLASGNRAGGCPEDSATLCMEMKRTDSTCPKALFPRSQSDHPSLTNTKETSGPSVLEEVKWVLDRITSADSLRNETFVQLMKQMTGNESAESLHRAWQLLCVLLSFVSLSEEYRTPLQHFIDQNGLGHHPRDIKIMAKYCLIRLAQNSSPLTKAISLVDIETAECTAFNLQLFDQGIGLVELQKNEAESRAALLEM